MRKSSSYLNGFLEERDRRINEDYQRGNSDVSALSRKYKLSERHIFRILSKNGEFWKEHGCPANYGCTGHADNAWTPFDYITKEFLRLAAEFRRNHLDHKDFDDFVKEEMHEKIDMLDEPLLLPLFIHICQLLVQQEQARLLNELGQDQDRHEQDSRQQSGL